ncbi:MAG TPA: glycosyltransferase family 4 protein [Pyrinomonadaceae bacterium]|jgi:glycosyltransferase involved in cell wall biosynthesis|nr:glycosyltransferase family 4 protein [Pyrinomonadaceae bacterium]
MSDAEQNVSRSTPRRALKVCHVVATAEGGRWVAEQLRELRDRHGCEVSAVVGGRAGSLVEMLRAEGIPYHAESFVFSSPLGVLRAAAAVYRLARLFRRERVDVVQSHLFFSMVVARLAAWLADVPVRLAMYASPFHLEAHTSLWIDRATCRMDSALIPSCERSVELCREMGVRGESAPLVYYGPDERRFDPDKIEPAGIRAQFGWPPDTPLVVKVAYFYPRLSKSRWVPKVVHNRGIKGHGDLVKAVPHVLAEYPDAKFLLVGSGWGEAGERYKREVEALVREMGLEESVLFPGYRADANRILREADVAVQASLHDNPAGTIESLLMECPTVVTRVGGLVDTVREGETGLQANPNDPRDLARRIVEMLREPERAREMGRAGRRLMLERFTLSRTAEDLYKLYRRLRDSQTRQFYDPLRSLWRLLSALPVLAYMAVRLLFVDMLVHAYVPGFFRRLGRLTRRLRRRTPVARAGGQLRNLER